MAGRAHFFPEKDPSGRETGVYKAALILTPTTDKPLDDLIKPVPPDPNPYLY